MYFVITAARVWQGFNIVDMRDDCGENASFFSCSFSFRCVCSRFARIPSSHTTYSQAGSVRYLLFAPSLCAAGIVRGFISESWARKPRDEAALGDTVSKRGKQGGAGGTNRHPHTSKQFSCLRKKAICRRETRKRECHVPRTINAQASTVNTTYCV